MRQVKTWKTRLSQIIPFAETLKLYNDKRRATHEAITLPFRIKESVGKMR